MRFILPLFLFGMLATSCIDNNYDLSEIDTDGVVIGDEFRLPLATVTVSMSELGKDGTDIKALFDEADIWLPSPLPAGGKYVDLQKIQHTPSYIDELLDELIEQMKRSDAKINAVADLLHDKYLGTFLPLLPPNTDPKDFKQVFITMFRATTGLQEKLAGEVRDLAGGYLTDLKIEDVTYDLGRIDLGSDVVDMLADNLDPKGTANPRNTLDIYGEIISALPVSLQFSPRFYPTEVEFDIRVEPNVKTKIGETRPHENDLRQIIDGTEIILPVKLEKYFPGSGFTPDQKIVIALRLVKRGGLKLNL